MYKRTCIFSLSETLSGTFANSKFPSPLNFDTKLNQINLITTPDKWDFPLVTILKWLFQRAIPEILTDVKALPELGRMLQVGPKSKLTSKTRGQWDNFTCFFFQSPTYKRNFTVHWEFGEYTINFKKNISREKRTCKWMSFCRLVKVCTLISSTFKQIHIFFF